MDTATAERVFRAYREGLLRKLQAKDPLDRPTFDSLFFQILWTRFRPRERLQFRKIWRLGSRGLKAAREGRIEDAAGLFAQAGQNLEQAEIPAECRLLARSILESAHAYLEHREGRFDRALQRTLHAMDCDLALEEDAIYALLEMHRVQAANNLMRVDLRCGYPERALALAGQIIAYVEGFADSLSVHRSWRTDRLRQTPRSVRRGMVAQVANEAVVGCYRFLGEGVWQAFFQGLAWHRHPDPSAALHTRFSEWLMLKDAFARGEWNRYLAILLDFLPQGRSDLSPLWYSAVIDFLEFCQRQETKLGQYVRRSILRDAAQWPALPAVFRPCLGLNADGVIARVPMRSVGALVSA